MTDAPGPERVDLDHLRTWIGRTEAVEDWVTPRLAQEFAATFAPHLAPGGEGEAPLALHWCLAPPIAPMAALGPDGHPARGGFLPPVPLPRRMWAGGTIEPKAPLRVGDRVVRRSRIGDVSVKEGRSGTLCFVAVHHEIETPRGLALTERHDIVYREAARPVPAAPTAAPAGERRAGGHPSAARTADAGLTVETSPVFLFRYSAMTFNGHRIHYDLPYVTGEEGYAGLVVHGPIQATLLLNLAATMLGRPPEQMRYRGVDPLTAGAPFTVSGARRPEGGLALWTTSADGRTCMEAQC